MSVRVGLVDVHGDGRAGRPSPSTDESVGRNATGRAGVGFFVADDGPGIPPSDRETVFDHGYTSEEDGTGLGLAIVDAVAGAHDWSVDVTESRDGGARFEIVGVQFADASAPDRPSEEGGPEEVSERPA